MNRPIYLDYNATTPLDPEVLEEMLPYLKTAYGNASSVSHAFGWEAQQAVETARKRAGQLVSAPPKSIVWTSGATESNNLALFGVLRSHLKRGEKTHLITSQVEHKAVYEVAKALEDEGVEVTYLAPDRFGQISARSVESAIKPHTRLISIILGQNEVGTLNPIPEIGRVARGHKILFHVDGAQAVGKTAIDVREAGVDLLSASAHKMYGPKGIGFLYIRDGLELSPIVFGGTQERGIRPGTLNVPAIVGFGKACEICSRSMAEEIPRLTAMRDEFIRDVLKNVPAAHLNGHPTERLYSNVSFSFEGLTSDIFALGLSGIAVSTGSACSAGAPSHVLPAIGLSDALARATVRLSLGRFTTKEDLAQAARKIRQMVEKNAVSARAANSKIE